VGGIVPGVANVWTEKEIGTETVIVTETVTETAETIEMVSRQFLNEAIAWVLLRSESLDLLYICCKPFAADRARRRSRSRSRERDRDRGRDRDRERERDRDRDRDRERERDRDGRDRRERSPAAKPKVDGENGAADNSDVKPEKRVVCAPY
jgi:hypothetical protein